MSHEAANIAVGNTGGKVRLLSLNDLDRRTAAYRRTSELIEAIQLDLGGADRLSTGERALIQRAAVICALAESQEAAWLSGKPVDAALLCTLGNAARRLLETVGLRRVPKPVQSLQNYLASLPPDEQPNTQRDEVGEKTYP
jgi:hypothetical protein